MSASALVMPGAMRPNTSGVVFTPRPVLRTSAGSRPATPNGRRSVPIPYQKATHQSVDGSLTSIEIESILRSIIKEKYSAIQQACLKYDVDKTSCISKGEFRRVLELFCPLTSEQFEAIIQKAPMARNNTVKYCEFLDKFFGMNATWSSATHKYALNNQPPKEMNIDTVEKMLREKLTKHLKDVLRSLHLYDYNRDGKIQRHDFRKVLENHAFKMNDFQFDRIWQRFDYHHAGVLDYKDFLYKIGVSTLKNPPPNNHRVPWSAQATPHPNVVKHMPKSDIDLSKMTFLQIELEFRKRMRQHYASLKRGFLAFDKCNDGFVQLDDLRSLLNHFIFPMSDQLFDQLMVKCEIKATKKISWEYFLEKFQDPLGSGNGQTITIKPAHKFFPIRESEISPDAETLLSMLDRHIKCAHGSFKNTFLQYDQARKGKITKKDFRRVIEQFKIKISDDEFNTLMAYLDPFATNSVSYLKFLTLFEPRETEEGHKWLDSDHRFNSQPRPAVLAWETIEDILREKITLYWKPFSDMLVQADPEKTYLCKPNQLRRAIEVHCLPLSTAHFEQMVSRCEKHADGNVNYVEFLEKLGIDVKPGDVIGLSTQIHALSEAMENERSADLAIRQHRNKELILNRTDTMSPDEVIVRLRDRMSQHSMGIRKAFLFYARNKNGKLYKKPFRQIMADHGIHLSDDKFDELCTTLGFVNGSMTYTDFVAHFDDPRREDRAEETVRTGNHRVNPIRGDEVGMTAEQVASKLQSKLREGFENLRGAFYKFDDNHKGILTKSKFRRLLDAFMFIMSNQEFERLCKMMGIDKSTRISYLDFINAFEMRDSAEGFKWISDHKYNEVKPVPPMSAEHVHKVLCEKTHRQWKDLSTAFITMDGNQRGKITKRNLREVLNKFLIPVTKEEFAKLWAFYDEGQKGFISHADFLEKLSAEFFTPGDQTGVSRKLIDQSYLTLEDHHREQQERQERITLNQAYKTNHLSVAEVEQDLKDKIRENYDHFYTAFRKYDTNKDGYISVAEFQKVLVDLNYFLDDDQYFTLMDRVGLVEDNSRLSYEKFLKAFQEGRKDNYPPKPADVKLESFDHLTPEKAVKKFEEKLANQVQPFSQVLAAFDKDNSGFIKVEDFRRVVDSFCFIMSDAQFKHMLSRLGVGGNSMVNYPNVIEHLGRGPDMTTDTFVDQVQSNARQFGTTQSVDNLYEVDEKLREVVRARMYAFAKSFADIDYAKIGVVSKADFRDVLNKHAFRLSDEQFDQLWLTLDVNQFDNVDYRRFLNRYCGGTGTSPRPPSVGEQRPPSERASSVVLGRTSKSPNGVTSPRQMTSPRNGDLNGLLRVESRSHSRLHTPLVNAEPLEKRIQQKIYSHWKAIQKQCRSLDPQNRGTIPVFEVKGLMTKIGLDMNEDDLDVLATKYDIDNNGQFCYTNFLHQFVITMKSDDFTGARKKLQEPREAMSPGINSASFYDVLARVQKNVLLHWKEMRRRFRSIDCDGVGVVSPLQFRKVLKEFSINLSEDEFFHLMSFYDKKLVGKISYNDFIGAFLKKS